MIKSPKILRVPRSTFVKLWDRIDPSHWIREDSFVAFVCGFWFAGGVWILSYILLKRRIHYLQVSR